MTHELSDPRGLQLLTGVTTTGPLLPPTLGRDRLNQNELEAINRQRQLRLAAG
jgi:hypothetical protein